jgi:hypothetical protein
LRYTQSGRIQTYMVTSITVLLVVGAILAYIFLA